MYEFLPLSRLSVYKHTLTYDRITAGPVNQSLSHECYFLGGTNILDHLPMMLFESRKPKTHI
jgi:hypothetical protein